MKKLFVLFIIVLFAAPAMAVDWNFYGSARMATWWQDTDLGDASLANGDDDDQNLEWQLQSNSRLGATVKAEAVGGRVELGITTDKNGADAVTSRRIYGTWNFGPATLKVGKDYTPVSQFISGQVVLEDLGLLGVGTQYGDRQGQLALSFGGFEVALIETNTNTKGLLGEEVDSVLPKIEAAFGMNFDMFNFKVSGGYQTYELDGTNDDIDVDSYMLGLMAGLNFGPGYVKGAISWGQNVGDARWNLPGLSTPNQGGLSTLSASGTDIDDTDTMMWSLIAGWKFTDMVSVEAGFGWREDSPDGSAGGFSLQDDDVWSAYVQVPLRLAPGVAVIPEFSYFDYGDAATDLDPVAAGLQNDEGSEWQLGAKWQIDF
jgi:hypothetical protein